MTRDEGLTPAASTNPKDAVGSLKLPIDLWPAEATAAGSLGFLEGALKYGRDNYVSGDGVVASIYAAAAMRHIHDWLNGEDVTTDTGNPHLGNALASLAILVRAQSQGKLIDDRKYNPTSGAYRRFMDTLTPQVARLRALFADKKPRHWTIADQRNDTNE